MTNQETASLNVTDCSSLRVGVIGHIDDIPKSISDGANVVIIDQIGTGNSWGNSTRSAMEYAYAQMQSWPEIEPTEPPKAKTPKPLCDPPSETIAEMKRRRRKLAKRRR